MEEPEVNMNAEDMKKVDSMSAVKKPKKRSLVERELETSLTSRVTSPAIVADALSTSRYGRARRLKTESDLIESQKMIFAAAKSPGNETSPLKVSPVYRMHASNSPQKSETPKKATETYLDNQIDNIYQENISLSRFSDESSSSSPTKKLSKVYVRKDLIQKREEDEPIMLIKNLFSPSKSATKSSNRSTRNSLDRSAEKFNSKQNGYVDNASVVKTLNFDVKKNRKSKDQKRVLSKNELFELEAKCLYQVGDLAWARMGTYPFWPCMITREPYSEMFVKKKLFGRVEHDVLHVTFFGDNGRRSWIVDNMLRNYLGQLEFEATREKFSPEDKKKDPRLYAAFFISDKKQALWNTSVEEAEILLREPKRLRFDIFNEMLLKVRASKKTQKSGKITRTDSDVSLSESLYDSLFSEDDVKIDDAERSKNRSRNKSFDVSEVVTACLDNMAAKTGITKIQRQSHMDRWLQKAKSKTPEKKQVKSVPPLKVEKAEKAPLKEAVPIKVEKTVSSKSKKKCSPSGDPKPKPYRFRNSKESQSKLTTATLDENVNGSNESEINEATDDAVNSNFGLGIITKVESLADNIENINNDKYVPVIITIDDDSLDAVAKPDEDCLVKSTIQPIEADIGAIDILKEVNQDVLMNENVNDTFTQTKALPKENSEICQTNSENPKHCEPEQNSGMDVDSNIKKSDDTAKTNDVNCDSFQANETMDVDDDTNIPSQTNEENYLKSKTVSSESVENNEVQLTDDNCNIKSDSGLKETQNVVTIEASVTETKNDDTINNQAEEQKESSDFRPFKITETAVTKIDFLDENKSRNESAETISETLDFKNTSETPKNQDEEDARNANEISPENSNLNHIFDSYEREHFRNPKEVNDHSHDFKTLNGENISTEKSFINENVCEENKKSKSENDMLNHSGNSESILQLSDEIDEQNNLDNNSISTMDISFRESNRSESILDMSQAIECADKNNAEIELSTNKRNPFLIEDENHESSINETHDISKPESILDNSKKDENVNMNDTEIELFDNKLRPNSISEKNDESSTREYVESPTFTQLLESEEFFRDVNESCEIIQNQVSGQITCQLKSSEIVRIDAQSTGDIKSNCTNHDKNTTSETKVTNHLNFVDNIESISRNSNNCMTHLNIRGIKMYEEVTEKTESTDDIENKSDSNHKYETNLQNHENKITENCLEILESTNKNKFESIINLQEQECIIDTFSKDLKSIANIKKDSQNKGDIKINNNLYIKIIADNIDNNSDNQNINGDCEVEESDEEPSPEYESLDEDITEDFRKHMMSIEKNITDKKDEEQIVKICNEIAEKAKLSPTKYTLDLAKSQEISPKDKIRKPKVPDTIDANKEEMRNNCDKYLDDPNFIKYMELRQDALMDENPQLTQNEIANYLYRTWLYEEKSESDSNKNDGLQDSLIEGIMNNDATSTSKVRLIKAEKQSGTVEANFRKKLTYGNKQERHVITQKGAKESVVEETQADATEVRTKRHGKRHDLTIDNQAKEKKAEGKVRQILQNDLNINSKVIHGNSENQRQYKVITRRSQEFDVMINNNVKIEGEKHAETKISENQRQSKYNSRRSQEFDLINNEEKTKVDEKVEVNTKESNKCDLKISSESKKGKSEVYKRQSDVDKTLANTRHNKDRELKLGDIAKENKNEADKRETEIKTKQFKERDLKINSVHKKDQSEILKKQAGVNSTESITGENKNNDLKMNGNATVKEISEKTKKIYRTRLSSSSLTKERASPSLTIQSSKIEQLRNSCEYDPKVVIIPLERDKTGLLKETLIKTTTSDDKNPKLRKGLSRLSLKRNNHVSQLNESIIIDANSEIKLEETESFKIQEPIVKEEEIITPNKPPKKIDVENGVETNISVPVMVNGFHHINRENTNTPDLLDDTDFDIDAVSLNSEDSDMSYNSVDSVPRRNLRSRPERTLENALKNSEFLNYLELKQDYLMDEHPELNEDEVVSYIYKTWQYEEDLRSDFKKIEDTHHSGLVKGLKQETPSRKNSKRSQPKTNIENLFREKYERCRKTFDFEAENGAGTSESNDIVKKEVSLESSVESDLDSSKIKTEEVIGKQETHSTEFVDLTSESNNEVVFVTDKLKEEDTISLKSEESLTPKRTLRSKGVTPKSLQKQINDVEVVEDKTIFDTKVKEEREFDTISVDSEDSEVPLRQLRSKVLKENSLNRQDFTSDKKTKTTPKSKEPTVEAIAKEEADEIASTTSDNEPLVVQKRKKVDSKSLDDPEFIKYLGIRQDALMDENPLLTHKEVASYLYKTWLYEEKTKSELIKNEELEQASMVKGLNDVAPPKKIRRRPKAEKQSEDNNMDVVPKEKPRRKIAQPFYNENYSDIEDELEVFEIFKTEKDPITVVSKAEAENDKAKSPSTKPKEALSPKNLKTESADGLEEMKPELATEEIEDIEEIKYVDAIEMYFTQLTKPKPNVFKGLIREKVCEICALAGNLVKCKGCNAMFHADCVKRETEVIDVESLPNKGRKKKKKPKSRKTKSIEDSESHSDDKSQDVSVDLSVEDIVPLEIGTFDAESFEAQLAAKMKEILETAETNYDSYSSDDGIDWKDTVAGKCEIVEVKLKRRSAPIDYSDYKCHNCQIYDVPVCFVCKLAVSKTGLKMRQKCHVAHCHKYYHLECLDHWPQTQFNSGEPSRNNKKISVFFEALTCPRHVCHTCVSDDPRGCKTRFSGDKLAKCVRCPATYHSFSKCLPAGSQILTASHIICPRHGDQRLGKAPCHVNTGWCFICAQGGSLICCEYCPTSFHAECLNIKPPEGNYMCEDCETGRLPLYGEMVWVKLGHYRWWPGMILHPSEIPENIMAVKHGLGEFVVRFFGQYDHYWVNRGRVFPYQEGDSGRISGQKSKLDAAFTMAIEHAQKAYTILKNAKPNDEESVDIASSLLPPHYVKLKSNKPCGSLCGKKMEDPSLSLTQCECNPDEPDPCGPYSQCLNRMLLTECGPTCRAGDRCHNRAFEKRLYPKLVPYRTPQRGWGLKTLDKVKGGQFVIEYVGELIDEEEFKRRMNRKHEIRDENFYFLTLDKERMIDAGPKGNLARFMNHCCEPNCETQKWTVLGDVRVGLFAIDDIPANSEVTFNYNLQCAGIEKKRCLCGAKRCSGYIGAKPKQDESQSKKNKDGKLAVKRTYKKKKTEDSPSTSKTKSKKPLGRPPKPKELTEIEKDLLIIKNATNGTSSDESFRTLSEEDKPRTLSTEDKNPKSLKRKRVSVSTSEVPLCNGQEPSVKRLKCEVKSEVGD